MDNCVVVRLWMIQASRWLSEYSYLYSILSDPEKQTLACYRHSKDQQNFVIRRGLLRIILGQSLNVAPQQLEFHTQGNGKPVLSKLTNYPLAFNLSHSQELIAIATHQQPIGIDVERIQSRPGLADLAEHCMSDVERQIINRQPESLNAFFALWTRKEAYVKQTGLGFNTTALSDLQMLDDAEIVQQQIQPLVQLQTNRNPVWFLSCCIQTDKQYMVSICTTQKPNNIQYQFI